MNIAFYTQQEITPYTGGIGRVTSILTDYFRYRYGWKVFSLFAETVPPSFKKAEVDGACQGRLHDRFGLRRGIGENTLRAARFLKDHQVDVVIVQTSMDVSMRLRQALQRVGCRARIITCLHFAPGKDIFLNHLSDVRTVPAFSGRWMKILLKSVFSVVYTPLITHLTRLGYRRAYAASDLVCLLSESYKELYGRFAGIREREKLIALPNPLSFDADFTEEELAAKKPVVLVVGRMSEFQKRISVILNVWSAFEKRHTDTPWSLKIVGGGASLGDYQRQAAMLGLRRCSFEGVQNPIPYYRESRLFLMTSAFEGFPMTLIEAQQFGCVPIVMDAFSSLSDIVVDRRNGRIVGNGDKEAFLAAMEELTADTALWHGLAAHALSDCRCFSQEKVSGEWKTIIERIVK